MSWRRTFIEALNGNRLEPRYLIRTIPSAFGWADLDMSSHNQFRGAPGWMVPGGTRLATGQIHINDWRQSMSQLSVGFHWPRQDVRPLVGSAPRGTILQILMGFRGWAESDYEPIYTGTLQAIQRTGVSEWTMQLRSILSALQSRMTRTRTDVALFFDAPWTDEVATPGYVSGGTTINVVTTSGAPREAGSSWLVRVTPDAGDPFLKEATATTATTFTVGSAAILGTTDGNASIGNLVEVLPLVKDHPVDAVRKIVCSTGAGTNGTYDTLPESWGLAVPDEVWDHNDTSATAAVIDPSSGTDHWHVYATEPQTDALGWLQSILEPAGLIFAERHGRLSLRAVTTPDEIPYGMSTVTDGDLVSVDAYDWWDQATPYEIGANTWETVNGFWSNETGSLDSKPAVEQVIHRLDYIHDNMSLWRSRAAARLGPWGTHLPEIVEATVRGWRWARLAPGDFVKLRSRYWKSRTGLTDQPLMVLHVAPDWFGAPIVRLRLATIPSFAEFT